jgi:hypothetical protein
MVFGTRTVEPAVNSAAWEGTASSSLSLRYRVANSSAVFDGRPFHRQRGDVPLDEGVEAGNVNRVRLGCF